MQTAASDTRGRAARIAPPLPMVESGPEVTHMLRFGPIQTQAGSFRAQRFREIVI